MKLTLLELKEIIAEALYKMPSREEIEQHLTYAKSDPAAFQRFMAGIADYVPTSGKLVLQSLINTTIQWSRGKKSYNDVLMLLDKLFTVVNPKRRTSYSNRPPAM